MTPDWPRLLHRPAAHFAWPEVREAFDAMDAQVTRASIALAQQEHAGRAGPCPSCGAAAPSLLWISIGTSDAAWTAGDERCGWLTVCVPCGVQVDLLLDPEMVALRRDGAW